MEPAPAIPLALFRPAPALFVEHLEVARPVLRPGDSITIGVHRFGVLPKTSVEAFDILLSAAVDAPSPWVASSDLDADIIALAGAIEANPVAAATLVGVLRLGARMSFDEALWLESLAYSTLLTGDEFQGWRRRTRRRGGLHPDEPVRLRRDGEELVIELDDPANRNAMSPAMRDALVEALILPEVDPTIQRVTLVGAGPAFSSGGHLDDFGTLANLAQAHLIRTSRSPTAIAHRLADRVTARVQGAAIGSGLEFAAAAGRLVVHPDAVFRLPEVGMGLIPGAGGTASIPRRIGRHRTAFMALTGRNFDAGAALAWGLADAMVGAS